MNATTAPSSETVKSIFPDWLSLSRLRIVFWALGITVGFVQTWSVRHVMLSDGMSYSQIAMAYVHGDWKNAINPYWSPFYSWVLALAYGILSPPPYWQVAVIHLVNYLAFLVSLFCFELFMREVFRFNRTHPTGQGFSEVTLLIAGYTAFLFETLSQIHIISTSPDLVAMALALLLTTLVWRVRMKGGSYPEFAVIGIASALLFLARAAFAPCFVVALVAVALGLWRRRESWLGPCLMIVGIAAALTAPFLIAISREVGHFTLGETGRLNYSWEVNSAPRFRHWQGEPKELGVPKHPTKLVLEHPQVFVFAEPIAGTYPIWFNPAYWYEGIRPHFHFREQLQVLLVNLSILCLIFGRSPIFIPSLVLIPLCGFNLWLWRWRSLWPVWLLSASVVALYAMVYVERRYLAANVLLLWMTVLVSVPLCNPKIRYWASVLITALCLVFLGTFLVLRQKADVHLALNDLLQRRETYPNFNYIFAEQIKKLGIKPGDRVAYIGMSDFADWTRLAGVKIVAEVPVNHGRYRRLFNNLLIDDNSQVLAFWKAAPDVRQKVFDAFRAAGVKLVVTDGQNPSGLASAWPRVVPLSAYPIEDPKAPIPENSRYLLLPQS